MIFTEKIFRSLQRELADLKADHPKLAKAIVKKTSKPKLRTLPERTFHDYEPSNIWTAYDGGRQRWRRMNEWFAQFTRDERESEYAKIVIKPLNP